MLGCEQGCPKQDNMAKPSTAEILAADGGTIKLLLERGNKQFACFKT
jgi:hypothetical protein